jgi:hypothetical protein
VHVTPIWKPTDMDFAKANANATQDDIADAAKRLRVPATCKYVASGLRRAPS